MATEFLNSEGRANDPSLVPVEVVPPREPYCLALEEHEASIDASNDMALDIPEPIAYPQRDNIEVGLNSDNSLVILKWGPVMTAGITAGQARKLAHLLHNCASQVRGRK